MRRPDPASSADRAAVAVHDLEQSQAVNEPHDRAAKDAYRRALGLLVRREHSRRELGRKLAAKGDDAEAVVQALEALAAQGYQDEARFAEMLIRTRINAGYGPMHIRAELGTHGIDPDVAASMLAEAEPDWVVLAADALRRRYGARPTRDRAEQIKRGQFLQRRGFDAGSIRAALQVGSEG